MPILTRRKTYLNPASTYVAAPAGGNTTTGLVSYWPMNEGSGTTFADSQSSHNGTLTSSGIWSGDFVAFDGGQIGTVADHADFNLGATFTICGWVNIAGSQTDTAIITQYNTGGANDRAFWIATQSGPLYVIISLDGTSSHTKEYQSSLTLCDSTWKSFAVRFDTGTLDLFVNGTKDSSPTKFQDDVTVTSMHDTAEVLGFGHYYVNGSVAGKLTGNMKKIRIYNIAKSDADILAIHNLGS